MADEFRTGQKCKKKFKHSKISDNKRPRMDLDTLTDFHFFFFKLPLWLIFNQCLFLDMVEPRVATKCPLLPPIVHYSLKLAILHIFVN